MITASTAILQKVKRYVETQLIRKTNAQHVLHNLDHTKLLVARTEEIAQATHLSQEELQGVTLSAWLYDLYHVNRRMASGSSSILDFLSKQDFSAAKAEYIIHTIRTCQLPQHPHTLEAEVLCDAVMSLEVNAAFLKAKEQQDVSPKSNLKLRYDWLDQQYGMLKKHTFFTRYAQSTFDVEKALALKQLKDQKEQLMQQHEELEALWKENKKLRSQLEKQKAQKVLKGIETLFRTTMASHLQLSVMADSKANLMISINAIIASIMISSFVRKLEEAPHLLVPSMLLTLVCVLTIIFAVLSTRPNVGRKSKMKEQLDFLFFGDFVALPKATYRDNMRHIMYDPDLLYNSMIDNVYMQGKVLARKYRLLKISYTIFMVGFGVVLLSYVISWLIIGPQG
ncbi:Pycsar system effector family protein [Pontibacter sp. CAU 1760]